MVHRESSTGDAVQLNMLHGTHFMASSADVFEAGKVWGPWLWYLNDGDLGDAAHRAKKETSEYPYQWFDNAAYQSRGEVKGQIMLSDGRPAAGAAVFLGDNHPNETALDMGRYHYYTTYASSNGDFTFKNVRTSSYGLQAWANGGPITDVSTTFLLNDVTVSNKQTTNLKTLTWKTQGRRSIFQIGDLDRTSIGFKYGNAPRAHALIANCPANYTHTIGVSNTDDWCYAQGALGTWRVRFPLTDTLAINASSAILSVSLAGYSSGVSSTILVNNVTVGNLTSANIASDPCISRSGTLAGEWHYYEFAVKSGLLKSGWNSVDFRVDRSTVWHGFMWDSVLLEWA